MISFNAQFWKDNSNETNFPRRNQPANLKIPYCFARYPWKSIFTKTWLLPRERRWQRKLLPPTLRGLWVWERKGRSGGDVLICGEMVVWSPWFGAQVQESELWSSPFTPQTFSARRNPMGILLMLVYSSLESPLFAELTKGFWEREIAPQDSDGSMITSYPIFVSSRKWNRKDQWCFKGIFCISCHFIFHALWGGFEAQTQLPRSRLKLESEGISFICLAVGRIGISVACGPKKIWRGPW